MAKLTQTEIKALADEWADLNDKITKAETKLGKELEFHIEQHNEAVKPILAKHQPKIEKFEARRDEIGEIVTGWLNERGEKAIVLEGEKSIAERIKTKGPRVIKAESFFKKITERGKPFWDCITVQIKKAEDLAGKELVDSLSTNDDRWSSVLRKR